MLFGIEHATAFAAASHDRNPLHLDAAYARRTPFGEPVLYGVASVLWALGVWADGRSFSMRALRIRYKQPIFFGHDYDLTIQEADGTVKLAVVRNGVARTEISFEPDASSSADFAPLVAAASFEPLSEAMDLDNAALIERLGVARLSYAPNASALPELGARFGLSAAQLPYAQLAALLWSSYFVGMQAPGRQALFVSADFAFAPPASPSDSFGIDITRLSIDPRFHIAQITGTGTGISNFTLKALRRPKPIIHGADEIRAAVGTSARFAGQTVFISGGGRGFGAALASGFALHGARVALNYRTPSAEVDALRAELGEALLLLPGDLGRDADCAAIAEALRAADVRLDVLINNASPQIAAAGFLEQQADEFLRFVGQSLELTVRVCQRLLPLLSSGGTVVNVSSIYARQPKARFAHYVAAKGALEGLARALAAEFPSQRFIVLRPPRMLTDQTNIGFDLEPPISTAAAVGRLLERLASLPAAPNYQEVDL